MLLKFHQPLRAAIDTLPQSFEISYVNDGTLDQTEPIVTETIRKDDHVRLLNLGRNFGHQAALTAGVNFADGEVVITMDGDGQHPPECIGDMLDRYERGFDIVLTQRVNEKHEGPLKKFTSWLFYRLINLLSDTTVSPGGADFRLMSHEAVLCFRQMRETHRFLRGLFAWMGFRRTVMQYEPATRIAGRSKYSLKKMVRLAYEAIFSFSTVPIRLAILFGFLVLGLALLEFLDPLILILSGRAHEVVPGWITLITSALVLGATQLIILAIIGQYVGLIYEEVKRRPLYMLRGKPLDRTTLDEQESQ